MIWNKQKGIKQMSKGKIFESLKIPFVKTCLICGEKYYKRVTKKGKTKGLDLNFVSKETFFSLHYYYEYHCYTCGYEWQEKYL